MNWVFAYGSLIWRPDFAFDSAQRAQLPGYERRFCQASHDHRGTPEQPGRVVTLVPTTDGLCQGMAYRLADCDREPILHALDEREQDGYQRIHVPLQLVGGPRVTAITWIAAAGNSSWREGESLHEVAKLIALSAGPSGTNREYLFRLEEALEKLNIADTHVAELSRRVRRVCERT